MKVGIVGMGAIGGFLGVKLSTVTSVLVLDKERPTPRPPITEVVDVHGRRFPRGDLEVTTTPADLATCDAVLVATKSSATSDVAASLAKVLAPEVPVLSMQNGLRNAGRLREHLGARGLGGVVSYNVFREGDQRLVQATEGDLYAGTTEGIPGTRLRKLAAVFREADERLHLEPDIDAVLAGKLLLNLNNGICAVTGLPIVASIKHRDARWCFAQAMHEGVRVMKEAGVKPKRATILPSPWIANLLALPDWLVLRVARSLVELSPEARSSTLQDLDRGAPTEIDELNGAIVWLADEAGTTAPVNRLITDVVHEHEQAEGTPGYLGPESLRARVEPLV